MKQRKSSRFLFRFPAIYRLEKNRENQPDPRHLCTIQKAKATQIELLFINAARYDEAPLKNHYTVYRIKYG